MTAEEGRKVLKARSPVCFLCRLIDEDLEKNGKLTDGERWIDGSYSFPVVGKKIHLRLEGITSKARA
jgi:hypothetical protein